MKRSPTFKLESLTVFISSFYSVPDCLPKHTFCTMMS
nr:MAG TPA_asm: hypothetical protein [Bacteriophage sp.]